MRALGQMVDAQRHMAHASTAPISSSCRWRHTAPAARGACPMSTTSATLNRNGGVCACRCRRTSARARGDRCSTSCPPWSPSPASGNCEPGCSGRQLGVVFAAQPFAPMTHTKSPRADPNDTPMHDLPSCRSTVWVALCTLSRGLPRLVDAMRARSAVKPTSPSPRAPLHPFMLTAAKMNMKNSTPSMAVRRMPMVSPWTTQCAMSSTSNRY